MKKVFNQYNKTLSLPILWNIEKKIFNLEWLAIHRFARNAYCSVLNNRPLLISIRGDIQAIKTQLLAGQYPCSLSKLIKNGNGDIKPKFELPRTKTVDLRQHWNFVQADVPNKNTGFLLRTLEYLSLLFGRCLNSDR